MFLFFIGSTIFTYKSTVQCETRDGSKTWVEGALTKYGVATRGNSDLGAVVTTEPVESIMIYVYFQDSTNRIRHLEWSERHRWSEDRSFGRVKGLSGTSIACATEPSGNESRWLFHQSAERDVQHFKCDTTWSKGTSSPEALPGT